MPTEFIHGLLRRISIILNPSEANMAVDGSGTTLPIVVT